MPGAIQLQSHTKAQWPQRFLYNRHPPPCPSWLRVRNNLFLLMLLVGQALTRSTGRGKRLLAQPSPISCPAAGRADARPSLRMSLPLRRPNSRGAPGGASVCLPSHHPFHVQRLDEQTLVPPCECPYHCDVPTRAEHREGQASACPAITHFMSSGWTARPQSLPAKASSPVVRASRLLAT